MKKTRVSVIVATYRRGDDLYRALVSLCKQSCRDVEIVLVDDNDESEWNRRVGNIVETIRAEYPAVALQYVVNQSNQGSARTRNIGIMVAKGEYVTFLDDDDVYLPEKIERQYMFMEGKNLDFSITDLYLYNESDKIIDKRIRTYITEKSEKDLFELHMKYHMTGTDTMMFRKEYIASIGGFPPINIGDEFYLMQRAIENGGKFGYLPGCDVKAYIHTGNGGLSSGKGKIEGENSLYEHKKKYFHMLSNETIKYITIRHHAVLAYAYLRMGRFLLFLTEIAVALALSPSVCFKLFAEWKK